MRRQWNQLVVAGALSLVAGLLAASLFAAPSYQAEHAAQERPLQGHFENAITLERDTREQVDVDGSQPQIELTIVNHFGRKAVARYAVELADELGNEMQAPLRSQPVKLGADEGAPLALTLPSRLPPGYYQLRVTVVARAGDDYADTSLELGIALFDGVAHLLSDEEWLEESFANEGVQS